MGLFDSPNIVENLLNDFINSLESIRTYIDGPSIIGKKSFDDHINKLDKVRSKSKQKGF